MLRTGKESLRDSLRVAIGARGFRRWYERQLGVSFACLTTGVLSLIMMTIALEMVEFRSSAAGLVALVGIAVGGGALCIFAWRQFHLLLSRAEYLAEQAVCSHCNAYGRFAVFGSREVPDAPAGCSLDVRCRACGNEWTIR
ncbi:MAG: hypothetical protein ABI724_13330 [Betaproteobacteria bacterium]